MLAVLILVPLVLVVVIWFFNKPKHLPPGPTAIPILGNVLSLGSAPHLKMCEWQKQYGDTFTCYIGGKRMVVMNNFDVARKVFADEAAAGRDQSLGINPLAVGRGLITSEGSLWREHRRFAISTLRDFGMGKTWLEDAINAEVSDVCDVLASSKSSPVDPKGALSHSVSNVICALVFGQRFQQTDEKFKRLTSLIAENVQISGDNPILQAFPFLKYVPGHFSNRFKLFSKNLRDLYLFTKDLIDEHKSKFSTEDVRDYIDAYVKEGKQQVDKGNAQNTFNDTQLIVSVLNLFVAGTETTSTTTLWAFVFMLENPEVVKKVQEEIDNQVGRDRPVRMDDRALLPFTEATILEVQRCASLTPLGVFHQARENIKVDGYDVPKGSLLAINIYSMHRDKRYWENPEKFNPNRFLDDEGKVKRPDGFVPFSIGKRACLGESLAKMELYLFFANIMQRFDIRLPAGKTISRHDCTSSIVLAPLPFKLIFAPRPSAKQESK